MCRCTRFFQKNVVRYGHRRSLGKRNNHWKKLQAMDDKVRYDAACKRLLSEKIILAWIMKSCLEEYRDYEVKEIARRYIEGEPQVGTVPVGSDESAGGMEFTEAHRGGQSGGRGKGDKIPL